MERYLTTKQNEALKVLKLLSKYCACMPSIDKSLTHKVRNPKERKKGKKKQYVEVLFQGSLVVEKA